MRDDFYFRSLQSKKENKTWKKRNKKLNKCLKKLRMQQSIRLEPNKIIHKIICFHQLIIDFCIYQRKVNSFNASFNLYGIKWRYTILKTRRYIVFDDHYYGVYGIPPKYGNGSFQNR